MTQGSIPAADRYHRRRVTVLDSEIAYVDTGTGDPVVFLHGNPTSSYLWRNVIPHVERVARCLAPDLVGMGESAKAPSGSYRLVDHARYLDAWFEALGLAQHVTLVVHDWGSALGFDWGSRHPASVRGIAYMEAIVQPVTWAQWRPAARTIFEALRSAAGEDMVLQKNVFVERILPASVLRGLPPSLPGAWRVPPSDPDLAPGEFPSMESPPTWWRSLRGMAAGSPAATSRSFSSMRTRASS